MGTGLLGALRRFGFAEGVSFLLLLGVAMPLKYLADWPDAVRWVGWAHGVLFIIYDGLALAAAVRFGWPLRRLLALWLASILPGGTFVADAKVLGPLIRV